MTADEYARRFSPEDAPGQEALEAHLAALLGAPHRRLPLPAARKLKAALDPEAAPDRSVELRTRSEEREDDPFDLPPE